MEDTNNVKIAVAGAVGALLGMSIMYASKASASVSESATTSEPMEVKTQKV